MGPIRESATLRAISLRRHSFPVGLVKHLLHPAKLAGFLLTSGFAVARNWSLPEFCWSVWLAGLLFTWACIVAAAGQIVLAPRSEKSRCETVLPQLSKFPPSLVVSGIAIIGAGFGWLAITIYNYLFGFYGIFLSVFASMEPDSLFGPDVAAGREDVAVRGDFGGGGGFSEAGDVGILPRRRRGAEIFGIFFLLRDSARGHPLSTHDTSR